MPLFRKGRRPDRIRRPGRWVDRVYRNGNLAWSRTGAPTITSFTVAPAQLNRANLSQYANLTLSWAASGFTTLSLYETASDGTRTPVPFVSGDTSVTFRRPSASVLFTLEAGNTDGAAVAHATFTVVANATLATFTANWIGQTPHPGGGSIGTMELRWTGVGGEPFPRVRLAATDGHGDFDSADPPHRDHTDHGTGAGSLRLSHGLGSTTRSVRYTLTVSNSVNSASRSVTFNWPAG